jgi:cytochrome c oxidase cbb3-type subunit 4
VTYQALRTFADSHGLAAMLIVYLVLIGWAFRPGSRRHNDTAANMIFTQDGEDTAQNRDNRHG